LLISRESWEHERLLVQRKICDMRPLDSKFCRLGAVLVSVSKTMLTVLKNLLIVAGTVATIIGIQVLVCSPRDKLVSKMEAWGAVTRVTLPPGHKLVNTSWKNNDLWVLTRENVPGETSDQVWSLDEYSGWGLLNIHIVLRETLKQAP
jgi:hypothetical protein